MTYLLISIVFVVVAAVALAIALARATGRAALVRRWLVPAIATGVVLAVLTIVFDNAMIADGLMTYGSRAISGARIGLVPLEDLAYPFAGLLLLPALWLLGRRRS